MWPSCLAPNSTPNSNAAARSQAATQPMWSLSQNCVMTASYARKTEKKPGQLTVVGQLELRVRPARLPAGCGRPQVQLAMSPGVTGRAWGCGLCMERVWQGSGNGRTLAEPCHTLTRVLPGCRLRGRGIRIYHPPSCTG